MAKGWLYCLLAFIGAFGAGAYVLIERDAAHEPEQHASTPATSAQVVKAAAPRLEHEAPKPAPVSLSSAYAKFQMGDYEGSVYTLRLELSADPTNELLQKNLATALFALGLLRLQQGNSSEAESLLEESARLGHFDSEQVLASMRLKSGQLESAATLFDEMYKKTKDRGILKLLTDMALSQDDLFRAEQLISKLEEQANEDVEEKKFIDERSKRLELKKTFARNEEVIDLGPVQVSYSSEDVKPAAQAVARELDKALFELSSYLGNLPTNGRLRAVLYPSESFQNLNGAPPWAGAFFDGFIRIPVKKGKLSNSDIIILGRLARHEATHAYLYAHCGDVVPSWIGEGLAQQYERQTLQSVVMNAKMTEGSKFLERPSDALDGLSFASADAKEVTGLYRRAFVLTQIISQENGGEVFWKDVFQNVCVSKVSLNTVLKDRLGAYSAPLLWEKFLPNIKAIW